ncbi:MAG: hypothetical protein ACK5ZG_06505 [Phycisphaerae bacterium]|jgi:hypothetical protein
MPRERVATWVVACSALLALAGTARAMNGQGETAETVRAQGQHMVITSDLSRVRVSLRSLTSTELAGRDSKGASVRLAMDDVLAILPVDEGFTTTVEQLGGLRAARERTDMGWAVLTDDQTLPGSLDGAPNDDVLSWRTQRWGPIRFSLEDLKLLRFVDAEQTTVLRDVREDTVLLTNGDLLRGFVSITAGPGLTVETQPGKSSAVPLDRVAGVTFANPAKERVGPWLWLMDGTAVRVDAFNLNDSREASMRLASAEGEVTFSLPVEQVLAFVPAHERLVGLASLQSPSYEPWPTRRWTVAPIIAPADQSPLGASRIELPGPMTATWSLPVSATRFATTVALPESCRVWGDCTVIVAADGKELARVRLTPESPESQISAALPTGAARLSVTLDPGERGGVEDRVVLSRAMIRLR